MDVYTRDVRTPPKVHVLKHCMAWFIMKSVHSGTRYDVSKKEFISRPKKQEIHYLLSLFVVLSVSSTLRVLSSSILSHIKTVILDRKGHYMVGLLFDILIGIW
eukprot:303818_1